MDWLEKFARGLGEDQKEFGISLFGGDTSATPGPLSISVSMFGWIPAGTMTKRAGAQSGDLVFVSGTIGDAGGGLAVLKGEGHALSAATREILVARYRIPQPRLALGQALRGIASAALDVSDGLIADLGHIADVSKVRIVVEASRIPLSSALRAFWGEGSDAIHVPRPPATITRSPSLRRPEKHAEIQFDAQNAVLQSPESAGRGGSRAWTCCTHQDKKSTSKGRFIHF